MACLGKKQLQFDQEKLREIEGRQQKMIQKLSIPVQNGFNFVEVDAILRCEADRAYTLLVLTNGEKIISSKPLGHFEKMLEHSNFFRVHRSHLINLRYLKSYEKSRQGIVTLTNGDMVFVAKHRRDTFVELVRDGVEVVSPTLQSLPMAVYNNT